MWWSAATCDQDATLLKEKWTSIIHHTVNIHSWTSNSKFHQCAHPPLAAEEQRKKKWLNVGSEAHSALKSVVLEDKLLKDISQLTLFCHTGSLESYHAMLLKYCPKREHFSYKGMKARLELASLDHNMNLGRGQATTASGVNRYKMVQPMSKKDWVVKAIYDKKNYDFRAQLLEEVLSMRQSDSTGLKERKAAMPDVDLPPTISRVDKPNE